MTKRRESTERSALRHSSFVIRHSNFSRLALLLFTVLTAVPVPAAMLTNSGLVLPAPPPLTDAGFSILRVFGALTIVIVLFLAGVWVYRNWWQWSGQRHRPQHLQILESRSLGGRHALHVVGYLNQRLLLASSPNGVALVSHLPAEDSRAESNGPGGAAVPGTDSGNFVQALQRAIQRKA